jgi:hypothetical protein
VTKDRQEKTAWLEPISAVLRVGDCGAKHYDEYHLAVTVRYLAIDEVEIVGLAKTTESVGITQADWKAIVACFRNSGVKRVLFRRVANGVIREKWLELAEKKRRREFAMRYKVTLKCVCVEIGEDGTERELLTDGPTWIVPYKGMVAIQQLVLGVITKIASWGLARLEKDEATQVAEMTR